MAKKGGAKQKTLQYLITNFAVEIGCKADKEKFNKAWHKLWCNIHRTKILTCYSARYYGARGGRKKKIEVVESNAI